METSHLLHKEIKVTDIKVLSELREKKGWTQWEYQQKNRIKEKKIRLKNIVTKILEYTRGILTADCMIQKNGSAIWKTR